MRILTLAAAACCVAVSAQADIRPKVLPGRGVMVTYGPQDPAGFRVPAGYRTLAPAEAMQLE